MRIGNGSLHIFGDLINLTRGKNPAKVPLVLIFKE
jgi:hypothetical protein